MPRVVINIDNFGPTENEYILAIIGLLMGAADASIEAHGAKKALVGFKMLLGLDPYASEDTYADFRNFVQDAMKKYPDAFRPNGGM